VQREEWRPVPGFEGRYDVSSLGHVRRWRGAAASVLETPLPLVGEIDRDGYHKVLLRAYPIRTKRFVHRLVAESFIGPCTDGMQVNHRDGVKLNNAAPNLEYVTCAENHAHAVRTGLKAHGEGMASAKITAAQLLAVLGRYAAGALSAPEAARALGVTKEAFSCAVRGKTWRREVPEDLRAACREMSRLRQRTGGRLERAR
jgi:hypothetical protein